MIRSIHYLRGLAALLVVFYHTRDSLSFSIGTIPNVGDFLFSNGYIGVDLFFIISGFVIVLSTEKDSSVFSFVLKRAFRIYPLYAFCLLSALYLSDQVYSLGQIARALFIIQANYSEPAPWFGFSILFIAWTISYEIIFYIVFGIAMSISHRHRVILSSFIIMLMICTINFICNGVMSLDGYYAIESKYGLLRFLSSPMFFEFIAGMVLALFYINRDKFVFIRYLVPALSSLCVMYFIFFYFGFTNNGGHGLSKSGLAAISLVSSLLLIEMHYGIGDSKKLTSLGDLSYSIYMNQGVILMLYPVFLASIAVNSVAVMVVKVSLIMTLSIATYYYIEKPSIVAVRKIISFLQSKVMTDKTMVMSSN